MTTQNSFINNNSEPLPINVMGDSFNHNHQMIVILDFGSQYSELIARRIRETHVYSEVMSYQTDIKKICELNPKGIIFSGGPNSVYSDFSPQCDRKIWDLGIPILGICYGMQLMVQQLGGQVEKAK